MSVRIQEFNNAAVVYVVIICPVIHNTDVSQKLSVIIGSCLSADQILFTALAVESFTISH